MVAIRVLLVRLTTLLVAGAVVALTCSAGRSSAVAVENIQGAGSTLVAPLVAVWSNDYAAKTGTTVTYGAFGSSYGIGAISQGSVDFGASDAPLTAYQLEGGGGLVQIPWALTATVLSYQIPGVVGGLRLTPETIAGIFLGTLQYWDDPSLATLNPKLHLPHDRIVPVYRSDGSGDTYAFTSYLAKTNADWEKSIGAGTTVSFPTGQGAVGNGGVAAAIKATQGAIGYVSLAYALGNHLPTTAIRNQAGRFATPGIRGIAAAAATVTQVPAGNAISIVDPPASARIAYPISTFTYVIVPTHSSNASLLRKFIFYGLTSGQAFGAKLGFAPIPRVVLVAAEKTLIQIQ
jgi:phosphate transport system substrate-binding protein